MSYPASSAWRVASVAIVLGLLGSCAAVLALADSSAGPTAMRRPGSATARRVGSGTARRVSSGPARRAGSSLRSRRPVTAADPAMARAGQRLMGEAAAAGQAVSYRGVQIMAWWGQGGQIASVVQVWHRPGSETMAQALGNAALPGAVLQPAATQSQIQDGILAVPDQLLTLMRDNFQIVATGRGSAAGRPADAVELRRPDGSLAARFWLDSATRLPLRREIFDTHGRMISEDAYIELQLGTAGARGMPAADARPWAGQLDSAGRAALRARGWPLPATLPGHLTLFEASRTSTRSGEVVDLSYSDGLSEVSLFLQRGQLPRELPGWHRLAVRGQTILSSDPDERCLAWSARGFVYTMIAEAPPATVNQIVAVLPHDGQVGLWQRMVRGMRRLASWVNPFG